MVLQQLCGWTENKNGRVICATVATIGGLHLFLTPPQDVLGFLPKFSFRSLLNLAASAPSIILWS